MIAAAQSDNRVHSNHRGFTVYKYTGMMCQQPLLECGGFGSNSMFPVSLLRVFWSVGALSLSFSRDSKKLKNEKKITIIKILELSITYSTYLHT